MANGFKALRHVGGGNQRYSEYEIAVDAADIFNGDMVIITAGEIVIGATNEAHIGTFVGCMFVNAAGEQKFSPYWTASPGATEIKGLVNEDKGVSYNVVDTSGALTVGALCDLDYTAGSPKTGQSAAGVGASTNGDFQVLSIVDADNDRVEIKIV